MIEFSHLNKTFVSRAGKVEALKDVSLTVENGDIYGVIGFSGAGKSTLIRMANLLERPDSGSIKVDGVELTGQTEAQLIPVRRKIGMVFQQFNLLESRTVASYPKTISGFLLAFAVTAVGTLLWQHFFIKFALVGVILFIYCTLYRAQLARLWTMGLGILRGIFHKR